MSGLQTLKNTSGISKRHFNKRNVT